MSLFPRADSTMTPSAEYLAEDNSTKILSTVGVFGFLALVTVSLRLFVRGAILKYTGADDVIIILTMAVGIAVFVCFVGESYYGLGRHYQVVMEHQTTYLHWEFAHSLFSLFGIAMVKVSVSLTLLRLVPHRHYRHFLWFIIFFLSAYTLACAFTIIFSCMPISANWDVSQRATAKCFTLKTYTSLGITNSVFTMLTDIILAILPVPVVMKLQINKRTRIALSIVLSLGFAAAACGAVKTFYQYGVLYTPDSRLNQFFVWAALELYVGIIACSLPSLRPLVAVALKSARTTLGGSGHGTVEQVHTVRSQRVGFGYQKNSDAESFASETALKTGGTSVTASPAFDDFDARSNKKTHYFGVNSFVTYDVDVERSLSGQIPLEDLPTSSPSRSNPSGSSDRQGIIKTMKVVTHSESVAP